MVVEDETRLADLLRRRLAEARKFGLDPVIVSRVQAALLRLSIHGVAGRSALRAFSSVDGAGT